MIVALLSSTSGVIAIQQDASGVIFSVAAAGVITTLSGAPAVQFAIITLMIVITTTMARVILLILGVFKLGGITCFLPYPVTGKIFKGAKLHE